MHTDEDSGQTVISGMGELHLDIIVDRLRREFGVEINQGAPQVNYKEALTKTVQHREVFKKQTGGRGKFADIIFEIGPATKVRSDSRSWMRSRAVIFPRSSFLLFRKVLLRRWTTALWPATRWTR